MKKRIAVTALLLCVAFVMASMAYSAATVTSTATLRVVNTDTALLALIPVDKSLVGAKDGTAFVSGSGDNRGEMVFQFGKSACGFPGLQPNSSYQWLPLFSVKNNSADTIEVRISALGNANQKCDLSNYISFRGDTSKAWDKVLTIATIKPGDSANISVKIDLPRGGNITLNDILGSIVVTGTAK